MSAPDRFIAWCKQEQASLQQQLELLEASKVLTGEDRGSGWVNTSAESKTRVKERLAELESLLTETGSATVSKPTNGSILPDATIKRIQQSKRWRPVLRRAEKWARNISSPASAFRCVFGLTNRGKAQSPNRKEL